MSEYDNPKVPPATPPWVNENASANDARRKADRDGDSDEGGSNRSDLEEAPRAGEPAESGKSGLSVPRFDPAHSGTANKALPDRAPMERPETAQDGNTPLTERARRDGMGEEEADRQPPD